jgi:hypothetical protein
MAEGLRPGDLLAVEPHEQRPGSFRVMRPDDPDSTRPYGFTEEQIEEIKALYASGQKAKARRLEREIRKAWGQ